MPDHYEPNSIDEIHRVFATLNKMDLETVEVDEIRKELETLPFLKHPGVVTYR